VETKIIIGGFGGQGILFLGSILAYTCMLESKQVTWFPSYGAEIRGGTANCTVVISDESIGSPIVKNPDVLIAMSDASLKKFKPNLKKNGMLVIDSSLIKTPVSRNDIEIVAVPATEISSRNGNTKSANMVLLGAFMTRSEIVKKASVFKALERTIAGGNSKSIDINKKAITEGIRFIEDTKG
jgi:2-oxoglutarate ferredoxin oxidoreductase subunit gamma